ncbi:hypothetical protein V8F33_005008 [Rhypophila sp. PSN 637]
MQGPRAALKGPGQRRGWRMRTPHTPPVPRYPDPAWTAAPHMPVAYSTPPTRPPAAIDLGQQASIKDCQIKLVDYLASTLDVCSIPTWGGSTITQPQETPQATLTVSSAHAILQIAAMHQRSLHFLTFQELTVCQSPKVTRPYTKPQQGKQPLSVHHTSPDSFSARENITRCQRRSVLQSLAAVDQHEVMSKEQLARFGVQGTCELQSVRRISGGRELGTGRYHSPENVDTGIREAA